MPTHQKSMPADSHCAGSTRKPMVACLDCSGLSSGLPPATTSYCWLPGRHEAPREAATVARSGVAVHEYLSLVTPKGWGAAATCGTVGAWKPVPTEPRISAWGDSFQRKATL